MKGLKSHLQEAEKHNAGSSQTSPTSSRKRGLWDLELTEKLQQVEQLVNETTKKDQELIQALRDERYVLHQEMETPEPIVVKLASTNLKQPSSRMRRRSVRPSKGK